VIEHTVAGRSILGRRQRCSTRVQDLDSSPIRVPFFWDLDLDLRPVDLDLDLTPPDLRLGLDISLMENPDSQSEILNHLFLKSIKADPILGSSLFSKLL